MSVPRLSIILITRDEAANVAGCLASVAFADEWIVVDAASTDRTREIARAAGATVIETSDWPGFGAQKNRALAAATGDWVLSLDADERVTPALAAAIQRAIGRAAGGAGLRRAQPERAREDAAGRDAGADFRSETVGSPTAYELARLSNFCGHWMRHGDWYPDRVTRLFRRGSARFSDDLVHERLLVDGPVGRLDGELLHDSMPDLDSALDKMNRYTTGRAIDRHRAGRKGGLARGLAHAAWAFFRCYILRRGFFDGAAGLMLALYVAEGTYYRYLKLGLLARPPRRPFDAEIRPADRPTA